MLRLSIIFDRPISQSLVLSHHIKGGGGFNPFETYYIVKLDHETPATGLKSEIFETATT